MSDAAFTLPTLLPTFDSSWITGAACRDHPDPDLWFLERRYHQEHTASQQAASQEAKAICRTCPVTDECLEFAFETFASHGIFGGLTPNERKALRAKTSDTRRALPRPCRHCGNEFVPGYTSRVYAQFCSRTCRDRRRRARG